MCVCVSISWAIKITNLGFDKTNSYATDKKNNLLDKSLSCNVDSLSLIPITSDMIEFNAWALGSLNESFKTCGSSWEAWTHGWKETLPETYVYENIST